MWFDTHWHARDWREAHKETVAHSLKVAYLAGADKIATPYDVFQEVFSCLKKQRMRSS